MDYSEFDKLLSSAETIDSFNFCFDKSKDLFYVMINSKFYSFTSFDFYSLIFAANDVWTRVCSEKSMEAINKFLGIDINTGMPIKPAQTIAPSAAKIQELSPDNLKDVTSDQVIADLKQILNNNITNKKTGKKNGEKK